jgi:uncharacterized damage-inducible protein DinB
MARKKAAGATSPPARVRGGRDRKVPVDLGRALVEAYLTNERITQMLLELLDSKVWRKQPPCSKRRNIATTFAHMHNVRCMRLTMSVKDEAVPSKLDRAEITIDEARAGLAESAAAMARLIERSLANGGHVPGFQPDVIALVCAALNHDAYHRGQVCHWAAQLGAPITAAQSLPLWEWDTRWKEVTSG